MKDEDRGPGIDPEGRRVGWCYREGSIWFQHVEGNGPATHYPRIAQCVDPANGSVIAAAPDLLDALKELLDKYVPATADGYSDIGGAVTRARAAVENATRPRHPNCRCAWTPPGEG